MNRARYGLFLQIMAILVAALLAGTCSPNKKLGPVLNQAPTIRLTQAPFNDGSAYFYAYRLNWVGNDPDGRIAYYEYAIDPPGIPDSVHWVRTQKQEQILFFTAKDSLAPNRRSVDFHTFSIRAFDNEGASSEIARRSFFSFTEAPTVGILKPAPNALVTYNLSPAVRIEWGGTDPDGQFTTKPVKYKYLLMGPATNFPGGVQNAIGHPDQVRDFYAPDFVGWDSTSADTTLARFTNLTPGATYLFVVVAFDEAGAWSPVFSLSDNMLRFKVGFAGNLGPRIRMFNEFFDFTYQSGGYSPDPSREVFLEVPSGTLVKFNWFAVTAATDGANIESYRWALDIADLTDNTPRTDEQLDVNHWSSASLLTTSATVGPFPGGQEHRFYIEAIDSNGLRSLGIVRFRVVTASLDLPLVIVRDTRFLVDSRDVLNPGCTKPPIGAWPTSAELDTFLFARGNVPWRCYPNNAMTVPGLFAGYAPFDTIGTRTGDNEIVVRLAVLGRYQHVVWLVDAKGAVNTSPGSNPNSPMTALRYMSQPGKFNTLAAYVKQGGLLWLAGGGGAAATLAPWEGNPNSNGNGVWSDDVGELIPGRFMYDLVAWRTEIRVANASVIVQRNLGRFDKPGNSPGVYANFPLTMRGRSTLLDPFPIPGREGQSPSIYYKSTLDVEFLDRQNFIIEDLDPDPDVLNEQSVLDTLYSVLAITLPPASRIVMSYYHGPLSAPLVFTGFSIWDFTRTDCQSLVDVVMQDIWGFTKSLPGAGVARRPAAWSPPAAGAPATASVGAARQARPLGGSRPLRE